MSIGIDAIERAYEAATGSWCAADWEHLCSGTDCETCDSAEDDAASAEIEGERSIEAARAGDLRGALDHAMCAASIERQYGDAPTWHPLAEVIVAVLEAIEPACAGRLR